jgi:hypothetical protein
MTSGISGSNGTKIFNGIAYQAVSKALTFTVFDSIDVDSLYILEGPGVSQNSLALIDPGNKRSWSHSIGLNGNDWEIFMSYQENGPIQQLYQIIFAENSNMQVRPKTDTFGNFFHVGGLDQTNRLYVLYWMHQGYGRLGEDSLLSLAKRWIEYAHEKPVWEASISNSQIAPGDSAVLDAILFTNKT